jgi:rhodanese-related sulfurtransferase
MAPRAVYGVPSAWVGRANRRRAPGVILVYDERYQSSLAAATLQDLGFGATDLRGGFQAWRAAGCAVAACPPRAR